jgi:hypothetical protein
MEAKAFNLELFSTSKYFIEIHDQKELSIELLELISNAFPQNLLLSHFPNSKGKKVSSGVNLEKCPYQVLDLIRVFDLTHGLNIRLMNWWGHGFYIMVFFGTETAKQLKAKIDCLINEKKYRPISYSNPWDYKDLEYYLENPMSFNLNSHLKEFGHLQLIQKITLKKNFDENLKFLIMKIEEILNH